MLFIIRALSITYDNAIAVSLMWFFFNIPEKGCISGRNIPPLSIRMGAEGDSNSAFPDSGLLVVRIGASWWGSGPCSSSGGDWSIAIDNA